MSGIGATEIAIIVGLVLVMGLFWGVAVFVLGFSLTRNRRRAPSASRTDPEPDRSGDGDRPDDGADDAR